MTSIGSHTLATFPKGESKRLRQRQKLKIKRYATIRYETGEACPKGKARGGAAKRLREERFGENADIEKMRKKIIKIRKIAQKQFTKEKNTNII